ncbi:DUF3104 domain-containing protein [Synechococcus sp. MIT S1220]|uniref:DUF3104 domain-containing protein n=1 Tax=Synechococcus sp. MIT S1220 TaxID=3082549 RepID=UPI0039AF8EFE
MNPVLSAVAGRWQQQKPVIQRRGGGAARDPSIHILFQIADVDSGVIRWVNADLVSHILPCDPGR